MKFVIKLLLNIVSLLTVAYLVPGFTFESFQAVFVSAVVIGIINSLIRPIIQIVALPISILTFGIFAIVINVSLLYLASIIVPGFEIANFWTAAISSILLSLVSWFLNHVTKD